MLRSIAKARGKLAVATADYMTPPPPAGGAVGGEVPSYYSLDVSGVGDGGHGGGGYGGGVSGRVPGLGGSGSSAAGQLQSVGELWNQQQKQQPFPPLHQQQQQQQTTLASPQLSQESLGITGYDSSKAGVGASSRSLEILQVRRALSDKCFSAIIQCHGAVRCCRHRLGKRGVKVEEQGRR